MGKMPVRNLGAILSLFTVLILLSSGTIGVLEAADPIEHSIIRIDNDTELQVWISDNNGTGSGTEADPYIIQGLNITGSDGICIFIGNTTSFLVVRDCYLHGAGYASDHAPGAGIALYSVSNVRVENNTCSGCNYGIYLTGSVLNTLTGNLCNDSFEGIYLASSPNNIISDNICNYNSDCGIYLYSSGSNTVLNNTCNNCQSGILLEKGGYSTLLNNTCSDCMDGIYSEESIWNTMANNTCYDNEAGIYVHLKWRATISNNNCSGNQYGVYIDTSTLNLVSNNNCSDCDAGIFLEYSYGNTIIENDCYHDLDGIHLRSDSYENTLTNNTCEVNDNGIYLYSSDDNVITTNDCGNNEHGIFLEDSNSNDIIENGCSNNTHGIYLEDSINNVISNNDCHDSVGNGIYLYYCTGSIVSNNTCAGNMAGISLFYGGFNTLSNNTCFGNNNYGVLLDSSINNTVSNNTLSGNSYGVLLVFSSYYNTVLNNIVIENSVFGIYLNHGSSDNDIIGNVCYNNSHEGIRLGAGTSYNTVDMNTIVANSVDGIHLYTCNNNTISRNDVSDNVRYGIYLESSVNNDVYGNTFIDNNGATSVYNASHVQAFDNSMNNWNTTSHGNYWSDWRSPDDLEPYGIVDDPYVIIGGGNTDQLPLTDGNLIITDPSSTTFVDVASINISGTAFAFEIASISWFNAANGSFGVCTGTFNWTATVPLVPGFNDITVTMTDGADRVLSDDVMVIYDVIDPTLQIVQPVDGYHNTTGSVTVTWTGSDNETYLDHYAVSTDGTNWTSLNVTEHIFDLDDGTHTIYVRAYDLAGNFNESSVTVTIDTLSPSLEILTPEEGSYNNTGNVSVTWTSNDVTSGIDHYEVGIDGTNWTSVNETTWELTGLTDGTYTVHVRAYDVAGNFNQANVTLTVDTVKPDLQITSPANGSYNDISSLTVVWAGSDDASGIDHYAISTDGTNWTNVTVAEHTFDLDDGTHTIYVRAYDLAGNFNESSVTVTIDTLSPSLEILTPEEGSFNNTGNVSVTWTSNDVTSGVDHYAVSTDGTNWTNVTVAEHTFELTDGTHTIYVRAYDLAGNFNESSVTFIVDTVAPTAEVVPTGENVTIGTDIVVSFSEPMNTISIYIDDEPMTFVMNGNNATVTSFSLVYNREYTVTVTGSDLANNTLYLTSDFSTLRVGDIGGFLVDEDQNILAGVIMELSDGRTTETTSIGDFMFVNVTVGDYTLTVELDGYVTLTKEVTVGTGYTELGILTMTPLAGTVEGVLVDEGGDPLVNVAVTLTGGGTAVTDVNGNFLFENVTVGDHTLTVNLEDYQTMTTGINVGAGEAVNLGELTLVAMEGGEEDEDDDDDEGSNTMLIIAAVVAALAVVGIVGYVLYTKKK